MPNVQAQFSIPVLPNRRFERRGECKRCGWCCAQEDCANFSMTDGVADCAIHPTKTGGVDTREPKCRRFPQSVPIIHRGCGYWFVDRWNDDRPVRAFEVPR